MPVQKVYFSIPPVNDSSTQMNNNTLQGGFSANKEKKCSFEEMII